MAAPIYRGYSTDREDTVNTERFDLDLVRIDLRNAFSTRLRERVRRQNEGSIIWDLLMDLFDNRTHKLVTQDAERIIAHDPRVKLLNLQVNLQEEQHSIMVIAKLLYIEFDMEENLTFVFREKNQ